MESKHSSFSISNPHKLELDSIQKISFGSAILGVLILVIAFLNVNLPNSGMFLTASLLLILVGTSVYAYRTYMLQPEGIKNNQVLV